MSACRRSRSRACRENYKPYLSDKQAVREISEGIGLNLWKAETDRLAGIEEEPRDMRGARTWLSLGTGVSVRSTGSNGSRRQTCPAFYAIPD